MRFDQIDPVSGELPGTRLFGTGLRLGALS